MAKNMQNQIEKFDHIVFLDIETPNPHNKTICEVTTLTTDKQGHVLSQYHSLVNPEDKFWSRFSQAHGIYPEDVEYAPTFEKIWETKLKDIFKEARVVVRQSTFTMHVLSKALAAYRIEGGSLRVADAPSRRSDRNIWAWSENCDFSMEDPENVIEVERMRRSFFCQDGCDSYIDCSTIEEDCSAWKKFDLDQNCFLRYSTFSKCWKF